LHEGIFIERNQPTHQQQQTTELFQVFSVFQTTFFFIFCFCVFLPAKLYKKKIENVSSAKESIFTCHTAWHGNRKEISKRSEEKKKVILACAAQKLISAR
jgi:hypothetical protein